MAVVYDQKADQLMVGSRSRAAGISVGNTNDLFTYSLEIANSSQLSKKE
jgi:hypothetical protein